MRLGAEALAAHDLVRDDLPADVFELFGGFVVGGSPFNLTDPASAKSDEQRRVEAGLERIAAEAAAARTAALFTCYGIGVVTRMLGGEVSRDFPEDTGPATIRLPVTGRADPLVPGLSAPFTASPTHKEGPAVLPPAGVSLAQTHPSPR